MTDVINDGSARWAGVYSYNSKKWRQGEGVINGWVAVGQVNQKTQLKMKVLSSLEARDKDTR